MSDDMDKQHQATAKRLEELKRKGQSMRSRDFSGAIVLIFTICCLFYIAPFLKERFEQNFILSFKNISLIAKNDLY